jgi:hypothetical protein
VISPLLANIYLPYVQDLWADRWRRHEATGEVIAVRYADDTIVGFERQADAKERRAMRTSQCSGSGPGRMRRYPRQRDVRRAS